MIFQDQVHESQIRDLKSGAAKKVAFERQTFTLITAVVGGNAYDGRI